MNTIKLNTYDIRDTIEACMLGPRSEDFYSYVSGWHSPHYQMPVVQRCAWCNSADHTAYGRDEYCPDRRPNPIGWREIDGVTLPPITWADRNLS